MEQLKITGGAPLSGALAIHGAKNSVLPILAACCLCSSACVLHNCPKIDDVETALEIIRALGGAARREGSTLLIDPTGLHACCIEPRLAGRMRSSVLFLGALLARAGRAELALPGGCPLGSRPVDLHVAALRRLGAQIVQTPRRITAELPHQRDADIYLPLPSVGATENVLLACARGQSLVRLSGAAREPEIEDLIGFLHACGADITGAGTGELTIRGVRALHGATYTILPDRIETASYLCALAGCGGDVELRRTDARLLAPVIAALRQAGCEITVRRDTLRAVRSAPLRASGPVVTAPYPGFPTDAQAVLMAALLKAQGQSVLHETIFERRFLHVPELQSLGADICLEGSVAFVRGVAALHGAALHASDLRGAAALVIAAMMADGESTLTGLHHLRRGYENFEQNLKNLGANIKSVDIPAPFVYNNPCD